jgi:hypothetical protein
MALGVGGVNFFTSWQQMKFDLTGLGGWRAYYMVFDRLTLGDAKTRDPLADCQVVVVGVDDATYKN